MLQGTLIVRLTSRYRTIEPITTSACPAASPPCPCGRRGAPGMLADLPGQMTPAGQGTGLTLRKADGALPAAQAAAAGA
jgi:hypothetical protein